MDFFDSSASCVIKDGTTILGPPDNPYYSLEFVLVQGTHSITATCTTHFYDGITLTSAPVLFEVKPQLASAETPTGTDVVVQPTDPSTGADSPIDLTFDNVQTPGTVSVSTALLSTSGGPHPPPNYNFVLSASSAGVYYEIKASSSLTFTGLVKVCITYDANAFSSTDDLALLHYEPGGWVALPNQTVNTQTRTVCADTQSFSPFLLAEMQKAPVVTGVTLPAGLQQIHTTVTLQAPFTDENQIDKHTGTFDLGYGALPGIVSESRGQGTLTRTHALDRAGVFQVTAAVSDGAITTTRSSALDVPPYLVVYDPTGGHVTGGGWIASGTGDCTLTAACTASTGKANFGFVSRFLPGRTTPSGTTAFEFRAASFRFESASYEWLVVAGARAQFKGDGSVNGATGYGFLLTAIDGQVLGGGGADRFRLKVWEKATGVVVYDNQRGADDETDATTALGGGTIVIHKN